MNRFQVIAASLLAVILLTSAAQVAGELTLRASNKTISPGRETCVAVTAQSFRQIVSMQYSMHWDPKVLRYKGINIGKLPSINLENFGRTDVNTGTMTFFWIDPSVRGVDLPDGAVLYELCFTVTGKSGEKSYFQFNGKPTEMEISNRNGEIVPLKPVNGLVKVQ